jgi:hypothetical protein
MTYRLSAAVTLLALLAYFWMAARADGFGGSAEHMSRLLNKPLTWLRKLERFAAFAR